MFVVLHQEEGRPGVGAGRHTRDLMPVSHWLPSRAWSRLPLSSWLVWELEHLGVAGIPGVCVAQVIKQPPWRVSLPLNALDSATLGSGTQGSCGGIQIMPRDAGPGDHRQRLQQI